MAIKLPTQGQAQPTMVSPQTKSAREVELENQVGLYQQEVQKLVDKNYVANLKDETFFRVELLGALNNIAVVFQSFLAELKAAQTGEVAE